MPENIQVVHLTPAARCILVILAAVLVVTSVNVQVVQAQEILSGAASPSTDIVVQDDRATASTVIASPSFPVAENIKPKIERPVKKKWQKVKGPDLETQAERSTEPAARTITVLATAYTSDPRETDSTPFTTANGTQVFDGVVAANFLKFGTRIRIPEHFGDKVFEVHDRMHPRFSKRVDIWMLKKSDARNWGARRIKIEVLP